MAIGDKPFAVFRVTEADIAAAFGGADELSRALDRAEGLSVPDSVDTVGAGDGEKDGEQRYIYTAVMDVRTCGTCNGQHGEITRYAEPGTESEDGIIIPPVHEMCRCKVTPIDTPADGPDVRSHLQEDHVAWMRTLEKSALDSVLGRVRAQLVASGELTIEELYDDAGRMVPLDVLGYNNKGGKRRR